MRQRCDIAVALDTFVVSVFEGCEFFVASKAVFSGYCAV